MFRKEQGLPIIESIYCNAHAQRKFTEARDIIEVLLAKAKTEEEQVGLEFEYDKVDFYVKEYKEIYRLWHEAKGRPPDEVLKSREEMKPHYKRMQDQAMKDLGGYSERSAFGKAMRYFVKNYEGFTIFLKNPELPIDNNPAERLLRSPVVGRKTWYGSHSKLGARTSAILFSLAESCKLNKVNPREYLKALVADLHQGKTAFTPSEYKRALESQSSNQTE